MTEGIILAGGFSSRMPANKMTKLFMGIPLILHAVNSLKSSVTRLVVVTGHIHEPIVALLGQDPQIEIVHNDQYPLGMFSSVQCGVKAIRADCLILPGDVPFIQPSTLVKILKAEGQVRVPTYEGKRGHPLFFSLALREACLKEPVDSSLKRFRDRYPVTEVAVTDPGILKDIDTMSDWDELHQWQKGDGVR